MTEQQLHPTKDWFAENVIDTGLNKVEPELPQPGFYSNIFAQSMQADLSPKELGVDVESQINVVDLLERQRLSDSTIQVSENLNDCPKGVVVEPTKQSDLCFGIGFVLGVTKEALGLPFEDRVLPPEMNAFDPQNQQRMNADMIMRPRGMMGMA